MKPGEQPDQILPPSSKHSPLVGALAAKFKALTPGDTIAYTDMEKALQEILPSFRSDVDVQLFRYLYSHAIRRVQSEDGIVMENIRRVGYRRATVEQVAKFGVKKGIPKIRKVARRVADKIHTINPMDPSLDEESRRDALTGRLVIGAVEQFTTRKAVDGFRRQALETVQSPSLKELLPKV